MEMDENVYCRLCAELKPTSKLIDMDDSTEKGREIVEQLTKLSLTFLDILDKDLPKTVCIVCLTALNNVVHFFSCIEKAQDVLKEVVLEKKIKCEYQWSSDGEASDFELEKIENVNLEGDADAIDLKIEPEEATVKKPKLKRKTKSKDEDIPLAELKNTWKYYSWLCAVCEMQFPTGKELITHAMECHSNCTVFKCIDCNRRKLKHDTFISHVMKHRKHFRRSCHVCFEYTDAFKDERNIHMQQHVMYDYVCPGCNMSFPTNAELTSHKEQYYTDKRAVRVMKTGTITEADLICKICKKQFKTAVGVQTHLKLHLERKREHVCDQCGKSFYNKQTLLEHLKVHFNIRPHQCKICKFAFRTLSQLRSHVGTHEGAKPFSCEKCGKSFRLQKCLNSHMIVHTDSLPHVCSYCERGFKFKSLLNQHLRQHTGVKPYSCDICSRPFTNWPNYNKHMKRRHGMNMAKKKHTADGVFPINPVTGEVQIPPDRSTEEWKKSILEKPRKKSDRNQEVKSEEKT